jgi:phosphopantetheinyl transferase
VEPGLYPKVEYNISHDGEYVLFGTTRGKRIGVDIMAIPPTPDEVEEALSDHVSSSFSASFLRIGMYKWI